MTGQKPTLIKEWKNGDVMVSIWSDGKTRMHVPVSKARVLSPPVEGKQLPLSHLPVCTSVPDGMKDRIP